MPKRIVRKVSEPQGISESDRVYIEFFAMASECGVPQDQAYNFAKAGIFLQEKQLRFAAHCREADIADGPTMLSMGGGRGSAKSHACFAQVMADDCQRVPGLKVLILQKVGKANRERVNDLRLKLLQALPHKWQEQSGRITFDNGSLVIIGHFQHEKDIDAYLGLEYDIILIEEATQITFTKFKNIMSCLRTSKINWRPRCYLATNPGGIGNGWYKQVVIDPWKKKREKDTRHIQCTVMDNKFCNVEYKKILESLTGWRRRAWLDGDWDIAAGQFFPTFDQTIHVKSKIDERQAVSWFGGFDYGFSHWSVFYLCFEDSRGKVHVVDEHAARQTHIQDHSMSIHRMLDRHNIRPKDLDYIAAGRDVFAKESDGKTIADSYANCGINFIEADVDRINGWAELLRLFGDTENGIAPMIEIHEKCTLLIETIPLMIHDEARPEDCDKMDCDEDGRGGDDGPDALRYAISRRAAPILKWAVPMQIGNYLGLFNPGQSVPSFG